MASRILVRRRKAVSDCITAHIWSVQSPRNLNHGQFAQFLESQTSSSIVQHFSSGSNASRNKDVPINSKDDWINISALGQYSTHIKRQEYIQWVGLGLKLQMIRHVSTATARQPNYDDEEDEEIAKKRKDASPEECDEAVVGLSMARAKVKPHLRESQKRAKTVLQRFWAIFFRAGPALRAVASISRVDWSNKLVHWKNEFTSTLQRYWLGFKLLGADVRISCRLLVKLADGKSLSRRERQQLTRTTADIFRLVPFAVFIIVHLWNSCCQSS